MIACYQAAAGQIGISYSGFLACDAQHCSGRAMQDHLIRDRGNFPQVGEIRVEA